ncbi:hypothetical protein H0H87_012647 [Tephrocybe sp. NHM501043]|nr:hypothetical protein H0H87_012647 [Tephrocybe sp. NHM501043]
MKVPPPSPALSASGSRPRSLSLWIASPLTPFTDTPHMIKRKCTAVNAPSMYNQIGSESALHPQKKRRTLRCRLAVSTTASSSSSSSSSSASPPPSPRNPPPPRPSTIYTTRTLSPSYYHGISTPTGRSFAPPLAFRVTPREERAHGDEGGDVLRCGKRVAVEGVEDVETKVKELYWWEHAALCHGASELDNDPGDPDGVYEHDAVYAVVSKLKL